MKRSAALVLLLATYLLAYGQSPTERCASDELRDAFLAQYPAAIHTIRNQEAQIANWIATHQNRLTPRQNISIPVVVHIVWRDTSENISEAQVKSQIVALNRDFRLLNKEVTKIPIEFAGNIANIGLEFCLATADPEGRPTNGITRTQTEVRYAGLRRLPNKKLSIGNSNAGGHTAWDATRYLNIWVAHMGDFAGQASFPVMKDSLGFEGVVIDARYFGTVGSTLKNKPYHLGRTATHEIGHFLNLCHVWGCEGMIRTCTDDDNVTDTPIQELPNYDCPTYPRYSCESSNMFMNYMDTVNDTCMSAFTEGQKKRMWATLNTMRASLLVSDGCGAPTKAPQLACEINLQIHPLPARNMLYVMPYSTCENTVQIAIYNSMGQQLDTIKATANTMMPIDISAFSSGIYFLSVKAGAERMVTKVMVSNF